MNRLLFILAIALCPVSSVAQVQVDITKRVTIWKAPLRTIEAVIRDGDTVISFTYRDGRYDVLREYETDVWTRDEFREIKRALNELLKEKYPVGEASATLPSKALLMKREMMGLPYIAYISPRGAMSSFSEKDVRRLNEGYLDFIEPK